MDSADPAAVERELRWRRQESTRRARTPERFCCPFESRALSVGIDHPAYVGPSRIAQEWQWRHGARSWDWFPSPAPRTQPYPLAKGGAADRLHADTSFGVSQCLTTGGSF